MERKLKNIYPAKEAATEKEPEVKEAEKKVTEAVETEAPEKKIEKPGWKEK